MKKLQYLFLILLSCQFGCQSGPDPKLERREKVRAQAKAFFDTFSERKDWEKFCAFYREDLKFEDVSLQLQLDSLWRFKRFYNWDGEGGNFQKLTQDQNHLTIENLIVDDSMAVATGHLNPFYYYGELVNPKWGMQFTIWLWFDEDLKIKRQRDWMEYDPEALENVVKFYRAGGEKAVLEWLGLGPSTSIPDHKN